VTEKFRVGVVTILEVEAVDWTDAAAVAEGALKNAINESRNPHVPLEVTGQPVLNWVARNREVYDAIVVHAPVEISRALVNGYAHVAVQQPTNEEE
jgi:hypothetical protein